MSDTVAAVVVTYNRKELLIECLEALRNQTHKPDAIFIIDNKSDDGTPELLLEKNYITKLPEKDINENQLIQNHVS
jgi:GT2 family glycosyltransferase